MPKLLIFTASQSSAVDARTNTMSIFEIIEELRSSKFPTRVRQVDFVVLWLRQQGEENARLEQRIRIERPDGREVGVINSAFAMDNARHRIINRLVDMPIAMPGEYKIELYVRPAGAGDWGLPVRIMGIPVVQVAPIKPPSAKQ
jgi:hypothetical protein